MAGQKLMLELVFQANMAAPKEALVLPSNFRMGAESKVEVDVALDGQIVGGFTVMLDKLHIYLPVVQRTP